MKYEIVNLPKGVTWSRVWRLPAGLSIGIFFNPRHWMIGLESFVGWDGLVLGIGPVIIGAMRLRAVEGDE